MSRRGPISSPTPRPSVDAGAALRPLPDELGADAVAEHVTTLHRGDDGHRDAARALAEEIAGMPAPDEVARDLPRYAKNS